MGVNGNRINIITKLKDIHYKCSRQDEINLNKHQKSIKSGTLSKDKQGDYYFSVLLDLPVKTFEKASNDVIGIDLGIKNFVIGSEGTVYENLHFKTKSKLKRLHKNHSRKKKGSNNRIKAKIKLAKQYNKINHQKEFYLHSVVNQLLRENQTIVMEDLNVSGMMKNHKLAQSIQEMSWSRFKEILTYKAGWYGRKVILIDRWFPSSKTCSSCGYIKTDLTLNDREWVCPECGELRDRDLNAAINIKNEGLKLLNLELQEVNSSLGMSLPEVTLMKSNGLPSRRSKNQNVKCLSVII
jgi:putative transposase